MRRSGRHSEPSWLVWNRHHPEDPILHGTGHVIHHKDHDHFNDSPDNLQKMTHSEHSIYHMSGDRHYMFGKKLSEKTKRRMSETHKGKKHSEMTKRKMSGALKGRPPTFGMLGKRHSEETRQKISEAGKGRPSSMGFTGKKHSAETRQKISIAQLRRFHRTLEDENA